MLDDEIEKAPSAESAFPEMSSAGCLDNSEVKPSSQNTQIKFPAPAPAGAGFGAGITCASMRAYELRGCLIREISRAIAIGLQAQAALFDDDDDAALAVLRRHWIAIRADITPLAAELSALRRAAGAP
jgi:hypothetical protein